MVLAVDILTNRNFKKLEAYWLGAKDIDRVNDQISSFLKKLYNENLTKEDIVKVTSLINSLISLKRISNRTKGFAKLAEDMRDSEVKRLAVGFDELAHIYEMTLVCYDNMAKAFKSHDVESITLAIHNADRVGSLRSDHKSEHLALASSGEYSVEAGLVLSEAARHFARIAHNIKSIAESVSYGYATEDNESGIDLVMEIESRR
jgi:phosphate:Na+ symporter